MKIYYVLEGCIDHFKNILLLLKAPSKTDLRWSTPKWAETFRIG
jgi:hypothetical protein